MLLLSFSVFRCQRGKRWSIITRICMGLMPRVWCFFFIFSALTSFLPIVTVNSICIWTLFYSWTSVCNGLNYGVPKISDFSIYIYWL
jgi:hypothetical protein